MEPADWLLLVLTTGCAAVTVYIDRYILKEKPMTESIYSAPIVTGSAIANLCEDVFADNIAAGWYTDITTGESLVGKRNVGELLMLIVSELAEGAWGLDGNLADDKLPSRLMIEVELADAAIRIFDLSGNLGLANEVGLAFMEKDGNQFAQTFGRWETEQSWLWRITRVLADAMELHRKGKDGFADKLALALHGIFGLGEVLELDVMAAIAEKRAFNKTRADHQIENRKAAGGKQY